MGAPNVQRTLAHTRRLEKSGELRTARSLYRNILNHFPKNPRAKSALAVLESKHPNLSHPPKDPQQQILALFQNNQFAELSQILSVAVAEFPTSAFLWRLKGMASKALGDVTTAETAFRNVINLAPKSADGYCNLGALLRAAGRLEQALKTYMQGQDAAPESPVLWKNLGNVLGDLDRVAEADAAYQRSITLTPDTLDAAWGLVELYEKRNRLTDLEARLDVVASSAPIATDAIALFTAMLHFRNKKYTAA